ncbi:Extracellular matrix protein 3 [Hypsibius exemplaris]|uniref:Extracellular matrix protein 3 n=1 Tax=Hypsibius exemplaris TaxID=2072580 RepID=A0A1W0W8E3_HYPEX|nr:Extracellular matrix protein 3 [Hypsibius exemplaris]
MRRKTFFIQRGLTENEIILLGNYDHQDKSDSTSVAAAEYECLNCGETDEIGPKALDAIRRIGLSPSSGQLSEKSITKLHHQEKDATRQTLPRYDMVSSWNPIQQPKKLRFYPEENVKIVNDDSWKDGMLAAAPRSPAVGAPVVRGPAPIMIGKSGGIPPRKPQSGRRLNGTGSTISFAKTRYETSEPANSRRAHWLSVLILREGNLSRSDTVRVVTKNGTARSGQDFETVDTVVNFAINHSQEIIQIRIIHDDLTESNENFTVHLYPLRRTLADVLKSTTTVTIQAQQPLTGANVRFPGLPLVTSLSNYERPVLGGWVAIGEPVICLTSCNPRHPDYARTGRVCNMEGIDDSQTVYSWKISHPLDDSMTLEPLQFIRSAAWFASINDAVLDSIYYTNGSIVQCSARAVTRNSQAGFESTSEIVTAVSIDAKCPYSKGRANTVHIDPYQASLSNMKNGDVKVSVIIPHRTGLVPLISTARITDLHMMLGSDGTRTAEHTCSNMIAGNELKTSDGFLRHRSSRDRGAKVTPLEKLRGNRTLEFYRNLDIVNCQWTFETTYSMSEVINMCSGKLVSDTTLQTATRREVSIQLPLFVSYAYFTNSIGQPWKHFDQSTTLDIVFTYNSPLTWSPEIPVGMPVPAAPIPPSALAGPDLSASLELQTLTPFPTDLKVLQVKIVENSHHMNVRFKTKPKFRGKFVTQDSRGKISASVRQVAIPATEFELKLLRTQENAAQPQQLWRFRTLRAAKMNYIGMYNITLIPCEFPANSNSTNDCTVQPPVVFNVYITDH